MSSDKVAVVRGMIDAWNDGDLDDVTAYLAEGIEWFEVEGSPDLTGARVHGRDDVSAGFARLSESWQSYRLEPEEIRDVGGDHVVAIVQEVARGRASGIEVAGRWGYLILVRDGKLRCVEAYRDPRKALEAARRPGREQPG